MKELRKATEDQMLNLKYSFLDKNTGCWVTIRVNDTMQAAITQVNNYLSIISSGQAGPTRAGVDDERVFCNRGRDVLYGYVVLFVGGTRAICRHTMKKNTQWSYEVTP